MALLKDGRFEIVVLMQCTGGVSGIGTVAVMEGRLHLE